MMVVRREELEFRQLPGRSSADPLDGLEAASSLRIVRLEPRVARTAHRHPRSEEVVYVAEGRGWVWRDGEREPVSAGDCFLVPAGVPHATVPETPMTLVCFFPHPDLDDNLEELDRTVEVDAT